ncbi:hypothetical protein [Cryptosporangium minutisporangium]|uniref:Integral membrane protein n=1 Tax=Cryptosporangium minutisporangium TaxID=113569 RepID=A0ABP6SYY0_9ACTN
MTSRTPPPDVPDAGATSATTVEGRDTPTPEPALTTDRPQAEETAPAAAAPTAASAAAPAEASAAASAEASAAPDAEVARLREELAALRGRLDTRRRRGETVLALRRIAAAVFVMLAAFALTASVVGVWAARTALDTDRWVTAVAPLPRDPQVSAAVAQYATTQLSEVLQIEQRLRDVLPPRAGFVVGPLAGQVRTAVQRTVTNVIRSDRFQPIWVEANRRAHQRALAIIEGRSTIVTARGDRVEIDLLPLINQALRQLSAQLPTLFGKQISLPDLGSGAIPENLRQRIEQALGVSLPANFAQFTVYDAGRLRAVQETVVAVKRDLALLVGAGIVLLIAAFAVSPRRRRTLLQFGVWLVLAAVTVTVSLRAGRTQLLRQVPEGTYRDGVAATIVTVTRSLHDRGVQLVVLGVVIAVLAYLIGPGRLPASLRRNAVRGGRAGGRWTVARGRDVRTHGRGWTAQHLDPLRIAGVVAAVLLALVLSSWAALVVIVVLLAVFEIVVTLLGRPQRAPV